MEECHGGKSMVTNAKEWLLPHAECNKMKDVLTFVHVNAKSCCQPSGRKAIESAGLDPIQDNVEPVVGDIPSGQQSYSVESFSAHIG
jgi:hypothetical protein